jgi:hypothetical protein
MSQNKTQVISASVIDFLNKIDHPGKKADAYVVLEMMNEISQQPAKMWGETLIGFDSYHYKYESGREGDFFKIGFSPRKQAISIYLMNGSQANTQLLKKLGKYKIGKACLYVNKLADIELDTLPELIQESYDYMTKRYG